MRDTIDKQEKQEILLTLKNLEKISQKIYIGMLNKADQKTVERPPTNPISRNFITKLDASTQAINSIL